MEKRIHSFRDDALSTFDAVALVEQIEKKQVSAAELATAAIERFNDLDYELKGAAYLDFHRALARTQKPAPGYFSGIPSFIKDNCPVAGLPTNYGSAGMNSRPAKEDGSFAKQYLAQGFTCLGKSQLPEFGFNATTEPMGQSPTRNPWHLDYSPGGSSGGAAALVASGIVPIAHANDGGGSIRIPAACCGLVGLKATRNRLINSDMVRRLPYNIVCEGVLSRSVRDTARFYYEAEKYYRNEKLSPIGLIETANAQRLRIGLLADSITDHKTDDVTRAVVNDTAKLLENLGHNVDIAQWPFDQDFADDFALFWGFLAFSIKQFGRFTVDFRFNKRKVDGLTRGLSKLFTKRFYHLPNILKRLQHSSTIYSTMFEKYDLLLTPVLGLTTAKIGDLSPEQPFEQLFEKLNQYACFTPIANASGGPAISLPMGATPEGLPVGIQFMANHGQEKMLLEIAFELEQARPWRSIHT